MPDNYAYPGEALEAIRLVRETSSELGVTIGGEPDVALNRVEADYRQEYDAEYAVGTAVDIYDLGSHDSPVDLEVALRHQLAAAGLEIIAVTDSEVGV